MNNKGFTIFELLVFLVIIFGTVGYGMNIVDIYHLCIAEPFTVTGILVLRVIGIFVAPVGAILGFF